MRFAKTLAAAALVTTVSVGSASAANLDIDLSTGVYNFSGGGVATITKTESFQSGINGYERDYYIYFQGAAQSVSLTVTPSSGTSTSQFISAVDSSTYDPIGVSYSSTGSAPLVVSNSALFSAGQTIILAVTGYSTAGGGFSSNISVSAVPLPAALPMFGAALIGAAAFGRRKAKKEARV